MCVKGDRIGGPTGTTWLNNGSFLPLEHLTGPCVSEQTHTKTHNQTGNTHIDTHTYIYRSLTLDYTHSFDNYLGVSRAGQFSFRLRCVCVFISFFS